MKTLNARTYRAMQKTLRDDLVRNGSKSAVLDVVMHRDITAISQLRFLLYDYFRGQYGLQEFTKKLLPALELARSQPDLVPRSYLPQYAESCLQQGPEIHIDLILRAAIILCEDKKEPKISPT